MAYSSIRTSIEMAITPWDIYLPSYHIVMGRRLSHGISHGILHLAFVGGRLSHGVSHNPRHVPRGRP